MICDQLSGLRRREEKSSTSALSITVPPSLTPTFLLARLSPRGSLDTTFGIRGRVRSSFDDLNGGANEATLQSDGRLWPSDFKPTLIVSGPTSLWHATLMVNE
jgi:hypothetical protein